MMPANIALLIEPKASARDQVREALEQLEWTVVPAESVGEARRLIREHGREFAPVSAVVCDIEALLASWLTTAFGSHRMQAAPEHARGSASDTVLDGGPGDRVFNSRSVVSVTVKETRAYIAAALQALYDLTASTSDPAGEAASRMAAITIVVTSDEPTPVQHEAALAGGAAAYLSEADATRAGILRHYLDAFRPTRNTLVQGSFRMRTEVRDPMAAPDHPESPSLGDAGAPDPSPAGERSLAAAFRLAAPDLRENGALSIRRIAEYLDVPQQDVAAAVGVKAKAASARPALPARDPKLQPFEDVIALVRDAYANDHDRVRAWLRTPRPELSGKTPLAVMLEPGHIIAVRDLVEGAWLGDPD